MKENMSGHLFLQDEGIQGLERGIFMKLSLKNVKSREKQEIVSDKQDFIIFLRFMPKFRVQQMVLNDISALV